MIHKTPSQLPAFGVLVDDMPGSRADVARYLGCNARVLGRWVDSGNAPRMASLSLWWVSRWGMSVLEVDGRNMEAILRRQVAYWQAECVNLQSRIKRLEALRDAPGVRSGNEAFYQPVATPRVRWS